MDKNYASLDPVFHALADPTRRAVVQRLVHGPAAVGELASPFAMALPSFMKHIGVLEASGLIASRKAGRVRTCTLRPERLSAAERWFSEQRGLWESRCRNLDDLLATMNGGNGES
jgi:DNA-binding transcriptional ArsR family regulator